MHGLLLIDKEPGCTSHDVVSKARRILKTKEIGHAGTLDPGASGLLVLLVGKATKLSNYVLSEDKTYCVEVTLGITTDTLDMDGQVISRKSVEHLNLLAIEKAAKGLDGSFNWQVPNYSAVKVEGRALYDYARADQQVVAPIKSMSFSIQSVEVVDQAKVKVTMLCSKGSFVRTWAQQLGQLLEVGACVSSLRRTGSGSLQVDKAVTLSELEQASEIERLPAFVPLQESLPQFKACEIAGRDLTMLKNGQISSPLKTHLVQHYLLRKERQVKVMDMAGNLVALLEAEPLKGFVLRRVFST